MDGCPTKDYLVEHKSDLSYYYNLAFGKNPEEELYDVKKDPFQLHNLAADPGYQEIKSDLRSRLDKELLETGDPRSTGRGNELDQYAIKYQGTL